MQENWTYLNNVLVSVHEAIVCSESRCDSKGSFDGAADKKVIND